MPDQIEFVSYDSEYPNLCRGRAVFLLNGNTLTFGRGGTYNAFWHTGGYANWKKDEVAEGPWQAAHSWEKANDTHPQFIIDILPALLDLFNRNVEHGCCGGCL